MSDPNTGRRLAPDSRWLLSIIGTAFIAIVSIFQWQLANSKSENLRLLENVHKRIDDSQAAQATRILTLEGTLKDRMDRSANLALERSTSKTLTREEIQNELRMRDQAISAIIGSVTDLREQRAEQREAISGLSTTLNRVVEIAVGTHEQTTMSTAQINQLLKQAEKNAEIVDRLIQQTAETKTVLTERTDKLESSSPRPR